MQLRVVQRRCIQHKKRTSHSCFQFQLSRLLHDNVLSISDVQVEEMKMRSNHKCMKCRTRRRKVFAVIYAKHKIAIKSRNSIYLNPESIKQYIQNCKLSRPPAIQCWVILVNMVISVILGHEKTKIQNIIDLEMIDVFSVKTIIHSNNKKMGHLI